MFEYNNDGDGDEDATGSIDVRNVQSVTRNTYT